MSADVKLKLEKIGSEFELPSVEKAMVEAEEMGRVDGLSAQDVVDFIEAIKYLVIIEGGGVSISVDHMKLIRSSLFAFTDLAFTTTSDNAKASLFCLQKLPSLLLNIQLINQRACEQTDFSQQTNDSYLDLAIASHFITDSLSRAVDLITSSTSKSYDEIIPFPLNVDHISQQIPHYWVRERICTLLALTLGNRIPEATKELVDFIHQVVEQEKRDSSQTLTGDNNDTELNTNDHLDPDETLIHDLQLDPSSSPFLQHTPKTYLLYTSSIDTFLPVNPETPHIRTAIAQMSAVGLYPNDRFILLCAWHDKSSAPLLSSGRPKSNFLPNPPAMRVERRKSSMAVERNPGVEKGRSLFRSWFERVALVRLVEIVDLSTQSGGNGAGQCSRMTVEVLEEKDVVGFEFLAGMGGGDLGRLVLENRVRDSLRFGAVRVEDEFVRAFF
ncbi:hypothetical protein BCR33DRAFT_410321 [Rhizoclosmatium globosum]|uniref:Uncharacterized protein n=1 Tax=Rhizoclosmatium globosum TaxID=329046 RepID=A0A1Y2BXC4_9FUNG|nr:hypothetical protein BCR33DRAFT_410321 [Rhizoclosmatium globosum]|eukprot:ORY39297.1 hypothetical protein BCR33DRAFT_410321 [Rhizoclosmatium globosum]